MRYLLTQKMATAHENSNLMSLISASGFDPSIAYSESIFWSFLFIISHIIFVKDMRLTAGILSKKWGFRLFFMYFRTKTSFSWYLLLWNTCHYDFCFWNTLLIWFNVSNCLKLHFSQTSGQTKFLTLASKFWHFPWESIWKNWDPCAISIQILIYSHPMYFACILLFYNSWRNKRLNQWISLTDLMNEEKKVLSISSVPRQLSV